MPQNNNIAPTVTVAVRAESYVYDKPYTYAVPENMRPPLPGTRVIVPFGQGNRKTQAMVLTCADAQALPPRTKYILYTLDEEPVLGEKDIRLALWMTDQYFCTFYDALRVMLPAGIDLRDEVNYTFNRGYAGKPFPDGSYETQLATFVAASDVPVTLSELKAKFPESDMTARLGKLVKRGLLQSDTHMLRGVGDKTINCVRLADERPEKPTRRQSEVLACLEANGEMSEKELEYYTGAGKVTLKKLEALGAVELYKREVFRLRLPAGGAALLPDPVLSAEQQSARDGLAKQLDSGTASAALLWGVTGSGKTLVYISLIRQCLRSGRRAIVLVPEISLTPQLLERFYAYFGEAVALLHSGLSLGERYDEWKRIKQGIARVVIGTRSAIFAPMDDIGLIVIDEEQEQTYRSEQAPRYHAREIAKFRAVSNGALLLLGSATPSVESMYSASAGKYSLYRLASRYGGAELPKVEFADMRRELEQGNTTSISRLLETEMRDAFSRGEQCILFINRRGSSKFTICRSCGYVPKCDNCSVSLTYHSANNKLMCHYCGARYDTLSVCPRCGSDKLSREGTGTQKVEAELTELFPDKTVVRMDADTTSGKLSHEELLSKFKNEKAPILLGTQMITKGLDFEGVTVVGVLDGDQAMNIPDFRASERAFSLITQVVGRAGRGAKAGVAVIQTFSPENELLKTASEQDFASFYSGEIEYRRAFGYPPFCDLLNIELSSPDQQKLSAAAGALYSRVAANASEGDTVFPPSPAGIYKLNNRYRLDIMVKTKNTRALREKTAALVRGFMQDKTSKDIAITADINPPM